MYRMSGVGRYLRNLVPDLVPHLRAERILLLGNRSDLECEAWTRDERVTIQDFPYPIFGLGEQAAWMHGELPRVHTLWIPQYNIPLLYRGNLIVTIHDVCHLAHPELLRDSAQRWYSRHLFRSVAKRATAILSVSTFTATEIEKYLHVSPSKVTVSYPQLGREWSSFPEGSSQRRSNVPFLLAVGNLKKHKNFRMLIAAFQAVKDKIPHELVIVGRTEGFRNFDDGVSSQFEAISSRVRFTGEISDNELRVQYREADGFVFPSIYEGFGSPLLEAMSQGCPIACSRRSSFPEVAGPAALYFDPLSIADMAEKLSMLATDQSVRVRLISHGKARVETLRDVAACERVASVINGVHGQD